MTLREVLNLTALCALILALFTLLLMTGGSFRTHGFSALEGLYYAVCALPWILAIVTGEAYGIAFFITFYYGGGKASLGYSRERAWARDGRGKEVAHAILWRDKMVGDVPGLMALMELAQLDPALKPEALRAALRLFGKRGLSKADRDHAGRLLGQAKIAVVRPDYDKDYRKH